MISKGERDKTCTCRDGKHKRKTHRSKEKKKRLDRWKVRVTPRDRQHP